MSTLKRSSFAVVALIAALASGPTTALDSVVVAQQQPAGATPSQGRKCTVTLVLAEGGTPLNGDIAYVVPVFGEKVEFDRLGSGKTDAKGRAEISFTCHAKTNQYGVVLAAGPQKDICCMVPRLEDGKLPMFFARSAPQQTAGTTRFTPRPFHSPSRDSVVEVSSGRITWREPTHGGPLTRATMSPRSVVCWLARRGSTPGRWAD